MLVGGFSIDVVCLLLSVTVEVIGLLLALSIDFLTNDVMVSGDFWAILVTSVIIRFDAPFLSFVDETFASEDLLLFVVLLFTIAVDGLPADTVVTVIGLCDVTTLVVVVDLVMTLV